MGVNNVLPEHKKVYSNLIYLKIIIILPTAAVKLHSKISFSVVMSD